MSYVHQIIFLMFLKNCFPKYLSPAKNLSSSPINHKQILISSNTSQLESHMFYTRQKMLSVLKFSFYTPQQRVYPVIEEKCRNDRSGDSSRRVAHALVLVFSGLRDLLKSNLVERNGSAVIYSSASSQMQPFPCHYSGHDRPSVSPVYVTDSWNIFQTLKPLFGPLLHSWSQLTLAILLRATGSLDRSLFCYVSFP